MQCSDLWSDCRCKNVPHAMACIGYYPAGSVLSTSKGPIPVGVDCYLLYNTSQAQAYGGFVLVPRVEATDIVLEAWEPQLSHRAA